MTKVILISIIISKNNLRCAESNNDRLVNLNVDQLFYIIRLLIIIIKSSRAESNNDRLVNLNVDQPFLYHPLNLGTKRGIIMSSISQTADSCRGLALNEALKKLKKILFGFFSTDSCVRTARIFHGQYCYDLVPGTAISNFNNMGKVTSVVAGDYYICIFEKPCYQGEYTIICPGEEINEGQCGSIVVSNSGIPAEAIRKNHRPPLDFWELPGPMYQCYFHKGYRLM